MVILLGFCLVSQASVRKIYRILSFRDYQGFEMTRNCLLSPVIRFARACRFDWYAWKPYWCLIWKEIAFWTSPKLYLVMPNQYWENHFCPHLFKANFSAWEKYADIATFVLAQMRQYASTVPKHSKNKFKLFANYARFIFGSITARAHQIVASSWRFFVGFQK